MTQKTEHWLPPEVEARSPIVSDSIAPQYRINHIDSFGFKLPAILIIMFVCMLVAISFGLRMYAKPLIEAQVFARISAQGHNMVADLNNRKTKVESMTLALANLAENLPPDLNLHKKILPAIMQDEDNQALVAGGGIWPEPFQFTPSTERRSFFWGRNNRGELIFYDDYNKADNASYHLQDWYLPAKNGRNNQPIWSKSYVDPYSSEPMVTCTVPMFRHEVFYGAATIDLSLTGLKDFFATSTKENGGYAFAVDGDGRLLSFPDTSIAKKQLSYTINSNKVSTYITLEELTQIAPEFTPLVKEIKKKNTPSGSISHYPSGAEHLFINDQTILKDDAIFGIFAVPDTDWSVITVTPYSQVSSTTSVIESSIFKMAFLAIGSIMLFSIILIRKILITPLNKMTRQLKEAAENGHETLLNVEHHDELGLFAHWYNRRSTQLKTSLQELQTARTELQEQVSIKTLDLLASKEKAEQANAAKSTFLANMSHELRTPLHAILSFSNLGSKHTINTDNVRLTNYFGRISESGERLLKLLNDLLDIEKMSANKMHIEPERQNILPVIESCIRELEALSAEKHIKIVVMPSACQTSAYFDRSRVGQVITNLLSNALKFSPKDSVIEISMREVKLCHGRRKKDQTSIDGLEICVADQGVGVPETELNSIFDEFVQSTHTNKGTGGTGLGLAICRNIIQAHSGEISVSNRPQGGAVFSFILPRKENPLDYAI